MSLIYGYSDGNDTDDTVEDVGSVKSFTTTVTFTNYDYRKFVKVFDRGIVLLKITTSQNKALPPHAGNVYYNFCNLDGSVQVKSINVLKNNSGDKVLDAYTSLDACSITAKLISKDKEIKLMKNVKTSITLRYIELPASINESNIWL